MMLTDATKKVDIQINTVLIEKGYAKKLDINEEVIHTKKNQRQLIIFYLFLQNPNETIIRHTSENYAS